MDRSSSRTRKDKRRRKLHRDRASYLEDLNPDISQWSVADRIGGHTAFGFMSLASAFHIRSLTILCSVSGKAKLSSTDPQGG
ncbi:hypothetical protein K0M31_009033 [Melipona bicolor]|uniref:Uncharacterized protein n=1 Tax=Melipona bicolor TaxID=60889 RepID=A0AA40KJD3_9HYME|nr:hypothetical protein K0M31_009033 [Melipona bicolor]